MSENQAILGKWRIIEADLRDGDSLDAAEPAYIEFLGDGRGAFAIGSARGGLDCRYGDADLDFTWRGEDGGADASGAGDAQLEDDGFLSGEVRFHLGDETRFRARRWP